VARFLYDAAGERVVKQGRGGDSITIGQLREAAARSHGLPPSNDFQKATKLAGWYASSDTATWDGGAPPTMSASVASTYTS
jgi:hypothetical protein